MHHIIFVITDYDSIHFDSVDYSCIVNGANNILVDTLYLSSETQSSNHSIF